jgi:hypothetical protein
MAHYVIRGFIGEKKLVEGVPNKRAEAQKAAYRLQVDIGGWWRSLRKNPEWENPQLAL